jgi:hypothetical protein
MYQNFSAIANTTYTYSFWVKSVSAATTIDIAILNALGASAIANISFTTTNSWQRVFVTGTSLVSQTAWANIGGGGTFSTGETIYIWGAQLVEGTLPQPYLPTTDRLNVPRIDYSQGTACMLLEPQRTNLILWSEDFTNAAWTKSTMIFNSNVLSPSGEINAQNYSTNGAFSYIQNSSAITTTSGAYYSISFYLKYTSGVGSLNVRLSDGLSSNFIQTIVNLTNGTIAAVSYQGSGANGSATIQNTGNGWYRVSVSGTLTQTNLVLQITNSGLGATTFSMYGGQFEAGAFSTTYIKTTSATVTRIADTFTRNNVYTNNLISASGGTWFIQLLNNVPYTRDTGLGGLYLTTVLNVYNNGIVIYNGGGTTRIAVQVYQGGSLLTNYLTTTLSTKLIIKWNGTTLDIFANGVKVVSALSFTLTLLENLSHLAIGDVPKYVQQMALWNTPLSDVECATLTSDVTDGFATASLYNGYVNQIGGVIENTNGLINNIQNFK